MTEYTARCERDDTGVWVITVPDLPGVVTQARGLTRARELATDAISLWLDTDATNIQVSLEFESAQLGGILNRWRQVTRLRDQASELSEQAAETSRSVVHALVDEEGLSRRDAAELLGISYQRVQQLVS